MTTKNKYQVIIQLLPEDKYYHEELAIMIPESYRQRNKIGKCVQAAESARYGLKPSVKEGDYVIYPSYLTQANPNNVDNSVATVFLEGDAAYMALDEQLCWGGGRDKLPDFKSGEGVIAYGTKIVVRRLDSPESHMGLLMPTKSHDLAQVYKGMEAEVLAVAPLANRCFASSKIRPGDRVYLNKDFAGGRLAAAHGFSIINTNIWDVAAVFRDGEWQLVGDWILVKAHSFTHIQEDTIVGGQVVANWVSKRGSMATPVKSLRQVSSGFAEVLDSGGGIGQGHPEAQSDRTRIGYRPKVGTYAFHGLEMFPPLDPGGDSNGLAFGAFWWDAGRGLGGHTYAIRLHQARFFVDPGLIERFEEEKALIEAARKLDLVK